MLGNVIAMIWLGAMSVFDIKNRRVPIWILGLGGTVLTAVALYKESIHIEGMVPGLLLIFIGFATKAVGYGDGVVLTLLGIFFGLRQCVLYLGVGLFLIAVCSAALLVLRKVNRGTPMPFLPFLSAAWILVGGFG